MKTAATPDQVRSQVEDQYDDFEALIRKQVAENKQPLFTTGVPTQIVEEPRRWPKGMEGAARGSITGLYDSFLSRLPEDRRQHYTCNCCRRFVERFGGLVTISDGVTESLLWNHLPSFPAFFTDSVAALDRIVRIAKVTGVFFNDQAVWGTPVTGSWTHLSGQPSTPLFKDALLTASQKMAEKAQDFEMLKRGIGELRIEHVRQAVTLLEADALHRSEKALGIARWLLDLMERREESKYNRDVRDNLLWTAVASAPPGYCHISSTMIASLLDDVKAGMDVADIQRRWAAKMHPLQYQRPTAPLADGSIKRAEEIFEKMGLAAALKRRFAKLEEVMAMWKPTAEAAPPMPGSIFGHLKNKTEMKQLEIPPKKITWARFKETVLDDALTIEAMVPRNRSTFFGLVTAEDPNAPPILQWDGIEMDEFEGVKEIVRNPVSWYFYNEGSFAKAWNLLPGSWVKVNAVADMPTRWNLPDHSAAHHARGALLVLEGCRDVNHERGGGFFPEMLRAEFREVRSVMEAHMKSATIAGKEEGTANGLALMQGSKSDWDVVLRVKTEKGMFHWILDRWE